MPGKPWHGLPDSPDQARVQTMPWLYVNTDHAVVVCGHGPCHGCMWPLPRHRLPRLRRLPITSGACRVTVQREREGEREQRKCLCERGEPRAEAAATTGGVCCSTSRDEPRAGARPAHYMLISAATRGVRCSTMLQGMLCPARRLRHATAETPRPCHGQSQAMLWSRPCHGLSCGREHRSRAEGR